MNMRQGAALAASVAAGVVVGVVPGASAATVRDELSRGTMYSAETYAACDVRSLEAEIAGRTLQVTIGFRAAKGEGSSLLIHVNTRGGIRSAPEFGVNSSQISPAGRGGAPATERATTSYAGKQVTVTVPVAALGRVQGPIGVQVQTCGEGAVDVAPGGDYFDDREFSGDVDHRYLNATPAERVIDGRVDVVCAASGRACTRLPVAGTRVRAVGGSPRRTYETTTDTKGRFALGVEKGTYSVTAADDFLQVRTGARRVDVTKRKTGSAAFEACGVRPGAESSAMTGGDWKGGNRDCLNYFEISWRPSSQSLTLNWKSIPVCSGAGGKWAGPAKVLLRSVLVDPRVQGTNLLMKESEVAFHHPIQSVHSGNNVSGTLRENGSGTVTAKYVEGLCTFGISRLALKR